MALRLIDDMADEWKPEKYHDTYQEELLKRIEEKIKSGQAEEINEQDKRKKDTKGAAVIDVRSHLRKSVEGGKKAPAKGKSAAANDDEQEEKEEKPHHKTRRGRKRRAA